LDGTVFRTLYVVVEGIAFWIVFESIYTTRVRNWYAYLLAGAALLIGVSTFTPAGFVVFTIIELISAGMTVKDKISSKIINFLLAYAMVAVVMEVIKILYFLATQTTDDGKYDLQLVEMIIIVLLIVLASRTKQYDILFRYLRKINNSKKVITFILLSAILSIVSIGLILLREIGSNGMISAFLVTTLVAMILVVYLILSVCTEFYKQNELEMENEIKEAVISDQKAVYSLLVEKNKETRMFRHDINNHLGVLRLLLEKNEVEEAKKYLSGIASENNNLKVNQTYYGNTVLDTLIIMMVTRAKECDIDIDIKGNLEFGDYNIYDLCGIFSNAFGNAIEACSRQESKGPIKVNAESDGVMQVISFTNPATEDMYRHIMMRKTEKDDSERHGFGIDNIMKAASRLNGKAEYSYKDGEVILKVLFETR
jgi:hypothetical protein